MYDNYYDATIEYLFNFRGTDIFSWVATYINNDNFLDFIDEIKDPEEKIQSDNVRLIHRYLSGVLDSYE